VMREESRYDPEALSYVGARGLMQVMPPTQDWIAEEWGEDIPPGDAFTPEQNIRMGAWFLRFLLDYFDGDVELAIAAYNGGAGSVDSWQADPMVSNRDDLLRWIGFGETREYLARVSLSYQIYQELYTGDSNGE
jgi:soluble lytic murein transglycosylase